MPPVPPILQRFADLTSTSPTLLLAIAALYVALLVGTIWRLTVIRIRGTEKGPHLKASLLTWWILITLIAGALIVGRVGVIVLTCAVSLLALREFLQLLPEHLRRGRSWLYVAVVLQYGLIYLQAGPWHFIFIPVVIFLLLPIRAISAGRVEGFTTVYGWKLLGLMLTTFTLSHVPMVFALRPDDAAAGALLVLYLLILTEGNDIAQSLWGRAFGKRKIVPRVSPNKALEGFLGGITTTVVIAILLMGRLSFFDNDLTQMVDTPGERHPILVAALIGLAVAAAGIFGDLTLSAIKRDAGVKDTGTLLPGHGGILDRVDSLLFAAPTFYWLMAVLGH